MAEEIQEAVQIIRVSFDGIELAMKIGSGGLSAAQNVAKVLYGLLQHEKMQGKTSLKDLLTRGGDLQVIQLSSNDRDKFERMAKKYGILYSVLPDTAGDGKLTEILFHSEATPRVNMLKDKVGFAQVSSFENYLQKEDSDKLNGLIKYFEKQKVGNDKVHTAQDAKANTAIEGLIEKVGLYASKKKSVSVDELKDNFSIDSEQAQRVINRLENIGFLGKKDENGVHAVIMDEEAFKNRLKGYQDLADRMKRIEMSSNYDLSDITISKTLIVKENDRAVKTRIPGTYGENARYLWINKENILDIHNGKTMLTFIDTGKVYKLYDEDNRVVETRRGEKLYTEHYDKVDTSVREKVEKTLDKEKKTTEVVKTVTNTSTTHKR